MEEDLSVPQLVGGAVAWLECSGLLIPSARDAGDNLVVFVNNRGPGDAVDPVSEEVYSPGCGIQSSSSQKKGSASLGPGARDPHSAPFDWRCVRVDPFRAPRRTVTSALRNVMSRLHS